MVKCSSLDHDFGLVGVQVRQLVFIQWAFSIMQALNLIWVLGVLLMRERTSGISSG